MTAVTHRNQEIGLEIKKSHYKSTEIRLEINRNQIRNHVISKSRTLHVAVSDPSGDSTPVYPGSRGLFLLFSLRRGEENKPLVESGN
jgi:acyl-CoA thioesterase FadM